MTKTPFRIKAKFSIIAILFLVVGSIALGDAPKEEFIILSSYNGSTFLLSFNSNGVFADPETVFADEALQTYGVGMADFDGDGDYDFVLGSQIDGQVLYYEKLDNKTGYENPVAVGDYTGFPLDFAVADYNSDGNFDFIFTNFSGVAYVFDGHGDGTFTKRSFSIPGLCIAADSADFNNDGFPDFVLQYYGSGNAVFYICLNKGDGTFTQKTADGVLTTFSWGIAAGDFDGDRNADIIAGGDNYGTNFYLYTGNGDGTFNEGRIVITLPFSDSCPADNYDFNNDGFLDFVCLMANQKTVNIFFNDGTGNFTPAQEKPISIASKSVLYGIACPPLITNQSPVANAGEDQVIELHEGETVSVLLDGSLSTDPDGDALTYVWIFNGEEFQGCNPILELPLGVHYVDLEVSDGLETGFDTVKITVLDKIKPTLAVTLDPNVIYVDGKMHEITATIAADDNSGLPVTVSLVSVECEEAQPKDIEIIDDTHFRVAAKIGNSHSSNLFAHILNMISDVIDKVKDSKNDKQNKTNKHVKEKTKRVKTQKCQGNSNKYRERVYTATYLAVDAQGNETTATATVTVKKRNWIKDFINVALGHITKYKSKKKK